MNSMVRIILKEAAKVILIEAGLNTIKVSFDHSNKSLKGRRVRKNTTLFMTYLIEQHHNSYNKEPNTEELHKIYTSSFEAACRVEGIETPTTESKENV